MASSCFTITEHVLPTQYIREYPGATLEDQEENLELHVKQYTPRSRQQNRPGAVTVIGAHANGFPKELYEPLWEDLYHCLREQGQDIQSIWIADVAHQGVSGIMNENKLGNDPCWNDHARDLLYMINHFRKEMPRPLVGIGHSMGGNHLVNLALMHPRLLTTVVLIDPIVHGKGFSQTPATPEPSASNPRYEAARSSTFRRDIWPSRTEAAASFQKSKFYQSWNPRVFDRWIKHGLRDLPTSIYPSDASTTNSPEGPPVTLSTSKHQEVFTFLRPNFSNPPDPASGKVSTNNRTLIPDLDPTAEDVYPFYRPEQPKIFDRLPFLRPSALYVFGAKSMMSPPEARKAKLERTGTGVGGSGGAKEGRVREYVLEDGGHLMPMENVGKVAEEAGKWLSSELERWRNGEEEWKRQWEAKCRMEKTMITEEWERNIGGDPRRDKGKL
ncbi:MAG: hypothetical protein Q9164_002681 [Protoblastenia rupestris]